MTDETKESTSPEPDADVAGNDVGASAEGGVEPTEALDPLAAAQLEASQLKEKLLRMAADFDNYRKRSRREVADAEKKGRDSLLNDLLPVFDNLERATSHAESGAEDVGKVKGLVDGIHLVVRQFRDALARLGIERVESVGQPFDPSVHEAIQHLETDDYPPGCIAAEVQAGYRQGERLVRPAMVVVAKARSVPVTTDAGDSGGPSENGNGESKGA